MFERFKKPVALEQTDEGRAEIISNVSKAVDSVESAVDSKSIEAAESNLHPVQTVEEVIAQRTKVSNPHGFTTVK
jgi:hypothetical protein